MDYSYFGFQQPNVGQQLMRPNMMFNPATSYQGAMPATLGGVGASPMASVQQGMTPNMNTMASLASLGSGLLAQAHQQPGQQQNAMQTMAPALMGLMAKNPQMMQGLMGGLGNMFSSGA